MERHCLINDLKNNCEKEETKLFQSVNKLEFTFIKKLLDKTPENRLTTQQILESSKV